MSPLLKASQAPINPQQSETLRPPLTVSTLQLLKLFESHPQRTHRELLNRPKTAIFVDLFSPKKFSQASENRAAGI
jgi:hypothetical protein